MEHQNQERVYKVVFTGEVDHGKSTLVSNLLVNCSGIEISPEEKGSLYLVDSFEEERMDCITIDTSQFYLDIDGKPFVLIDVPGHLEYLSNMVTGASHADVGVVLVDINEGVTDQTKRHLNVLRMLCIPRAVGLVTKTDLMEGDALNERIASISSELSKEMSALFDDHVVTAVSGLTGENIYSTDEARWKSTGTLMDALNNLINKSVHDESARVQQARVILQDRFIRESREYVLGFVDAGVLAKGTQLNVFGTDKAVTVEAILDPNGREMETADAGQSIALALDACEHVDRGTILYAGDERRSAPPQMILHTLWLDDTTPSEGEECTLKCAVQKTRAVMKRVDDAGPDQARGSFRKITYETDKPLFMAYPNQSNYLSVVNILVGDRIKGVGVLPM